MAVPRVEIKTQPWGVVQDTAGNALSGVTATIAKLDATSATVYSASTGATTTTPSTNSTGEVAGWIEPGEYTLTVPGKSAVRVQAARALPGMQGGTTGAPEETTLWQFQPRDTARAPFTWHVHGATFNGTWDPVMYFGYNCTGAGGRIVAGEPSFRFAIEIDYEHTEGQNHWLEAYFEWDAPSGASAPMDGRPFFWRFDRTTGTIVGFDIKSKGIAFTHWDNDSNQFGSLGPTGLSLGSLGPVANNNGVTLALNPAVGFGSAFQMQHGAANAWILSTNSSTNVALTVGVTPTMWFYAGRVSLGIEDNSAVFTAQDAAFGGDVFVGKAHASGQTGALFQAESSGGTAWWKVNQNGYPIVAKTAAPADAELAAGQCAMWFDSTNGAAKAMFKAKQADGTVRTGAVNLA